ncbi:hypothetical protein M8C21_014907 [Ambrosia artemisiifolia]|uniref:Knottins-like domain-containing protein n=1 Tax=Ambrosia artemisiifolia TaxID=4212 RepID=A0AAD5CG74_AMBAR|nr:hypothetical protein M8C21_014907 [Ambrosia artemisiifolia]
MKPSMKLFATLLLVVMCLMANEMGGPMVVEGRTCRSKSQKFIGSCIDADCGSVCQLSEGFPTGKCIGLRCFCLREY